MKNVLIDPLLNLDSYRKLNESIEKSEFPIMIHGLIEENISHITYALNKHLNKQIFIITSEETRAKKLAENLTSMTNSDDIEYFPKRET
ncbi:hypothetical protein P7M08_24305, partial [Vibrio parahaemolyticus]|nr:hypothetical protein [Vibrio parahaemolyticus]NMR87015.1 hypothetical protein [Vibrio parahaemolyticus]